MSLEKFANIESVIVEPVKFKAKLAIGEDAYASLRITNSLRKYWDLIGAAGSGAAVASSSVVAGTFFAPQGILGALGLATAATPVGWVVAAAVVSGGAWYGVMHLLQGATKDRVSVIPKFINTPIDALAVSLFDFMAPLALKVAAQDGQIDVAERQFLERYFVREWGYSPDYVRAASAYLEERIDDYSLVRLAEQLAQYQKESPDCNAGEMSAEVVGFLRGLIEVDGLVDEREEIAVDRIEQILTKANSGQLTELASSLGGLASNAVQTSATAVSVTSGAILRIAKQSAELARSSELAKTVIEESKIVGASSAQLAGQAMSSVVSQTSSLLRAAKGSLRRMREKQ